MALGEQHLLALHRSRLALRVMGCREAMMEDLQRSLEDLDEGFGKLRARYAPIAGVVDMDHWTARAELQQRGLESIRRADDRIAAMLEEIGLVA